MIGSTRKRTFARLFDDLVSTAKQRLWHGETERLGGLEIDDQLERGGLLDRQIGGLSPLRSFPA